MLPISNSLQSRSSTLQMLTSTTTQCNAGPNQSLPPKHNNASFSVEGTQRMRCLVSQVVPIYAATSPSTRPLRPARCETNPSTLGAASASFLAARNPGIRLPSLSQMSSPTPSSQLSINLVNLILLRARRCRSLSAYLRKHSASVGESERVNATLEKMRSKRIELTIGWIWKR